MLTYNFEGLIVPADEYIFLRDKFRVYNSSNETKTITIKLAKTDTGNELVETVTLKSGAWFDFTESVRDFIVTYCLYYESACRGDDVPSFIDFDTDLLLYRPPFEGECEFTYTCNGRMFRHNVWDALDCEPFSVVPSNVDIWGFLPIKDNYGDVVVWGKVMGDNTEWPCCDCNVNMILLNQQTRYIYNPYTASETRASVAITGFLQQKENCSIAIKKRMARLQYLRGDGTGVVRWCEVANETIKTAQTKNHQRLKYDFKNLWVADTHNDIKRTVTLEWRDFPPDEIDRIAMGIALTPTCYIYMDNGTIYSGTLEQSATIKIAGNLQITLNVEIA